MTVAAEDIIIVINRDWELVKQRQLRFSGRYTDAEMGKINAKTYRFKESGFARIQKSRSAWTAQFCSPQGNG